MGVLIVLDVLVLVVLRLSSGVTTVDVSVSVRVVSWLHAEFGVVGR